MVGLANEIRDAMGHNKLHLLLFIHVVCYCMLAQARPKMPCIYTSLQYTCKLALGYAGTCRRAQGRPAPAPKLPLSFFAKVVGRNCHKVVSDPRTRKLDKLRKLTTALG